MYFFSLLKHKQSVPAKIMQQAEKLDLDEEIKLLEKTVMRKELSTSTDRIKRTPKPTPKATFLTIVSDFTWGH